MLLSKEDKEILKKAQEILMREPMNNGARFFEGSYDFNESCEVVAKERGQVVVYPEHNQIQLDIDSEEQLALFRQRLPLFRRDFDGSINIESMTPSKKGLPHQHITLTFSTVEDKKLNDWQRLALQFALGSDPIKESLSCFRLLSGKSNCSCLFEAP